MSAAPATGYVRAFPPKRGGRANRLRAEGSRLDKRPRKVLVRLFAADERDAIIQHMQARLSSVNLNNDCFYL